MKMTHLKAKGFTLVELLVVIAIIAALVSLATPVILTALKKAKVVSAKAVCVSLGNAIDRFESEYSYLPYEGADAPSVDTTISGGDVATAENDAFMAVLAGVEDALNYKQIEFFTLGSPKGSSESNYKDGMYVDKSAGVAQLFDAWGSRYYFILDYDLDGEIEGLDNEKVNGKLALVYSLGPEKAVPDSETTAGEWRYIPTNFK